MCSLLEIITKVAVIERDGRKWWIIVFEPEGASGLQILSISNLVHFGILLWSRTRILGKSIMHLRLTTDTRELGSSDSSEQSLADYVRDGLSGADAPKTKYCTPTWPPPFAAKTRTCCST